MTNDIIIDKWGNKIDITAAPIGKLKAILTWMEGMVWRNNKTNYNVSDLIDRLPKEYARIADELKMRGAKPYTPFHWILNLHDQMYYK